MKSWIGESGGGGSTSIVSGSMGEIDDTVGSCTYSSWIEAYIDSEYI
jgi:hypothetical protein